MTGKKYAPVILLASSLLVASPTYAGNASNTKKAGDIIAIAIPALAYGSTHYMNDKEGRQQFYYSFATNLGTTYALKSTIDKERPDASYGLEYSIPAYIGAGFVGYSRVKADKHDVSDVLAGAALGIASSMYLTKSYNDQLYIAPSLSPDYYGLSVHYQF